MQGIVSTCIMLSNVKKQKASALWEQWINWCRILPASIYTELGINLMVCPYCHAARFPLKTCNEANFLRHGNWSASTGIVSDEFNVWSTYDMHRVIMCVFMLIEWSVFCERSCLWAALWWCRWETGTNLGWVWQCRTMRRGRFCIIALFHCLCSHESLSTFGGWNIVTERTPAYCHVTCFTLDLAESL